MNRRNISPGKQLGFLDTIGSINEILTWFFIGILWLVSFLPYPVLVRLGNFIGLILYRVSPHRREIMKINIERCLKIEGAESDALIKANYRSIGRGIFEMAIAWWSSEKRISKIDTRIINKEILENSGEGILVLIKHSTHLELDLRLLSKYFDLSGMYKLQTNNVINYVMISARNKYIKGSLTNKEAIKAIRWINSGRKFLYAADQDYGLKVSEIVPFFGLDAATVAFPKILAEKKIKIVFADVSKIGDVFEIELRELKTAESDHFLQNMNEIYSEFILKEKEGYLWMHRRFKSGYAESVYPKWSRRDRNREKRRINRIN